MRLHLLMCAKNEAGRYLGAVLAWHHSMFDSVFVYDDRSTDSTVAVALEHGAGVVIRPLEVPGFLQHEGAFRQAAWDAFGLVTQPSEEDWVLVLDADEFFQPFDEGERLRDLARVAADEGALSVDLRIDEVFDNTGAQPRRRVDGFWGTIHGSRLVRFQCGGRFTDVAMGGGSVPSYAKARTHDARGDECSILHYGYARPDDRVAKYERYAAVARNGHASSHIESILGPPTLEPISCSRWPAL